jgi:dolichyl-phosphate beta-glucosyltransferase
MASAKIVIPCFNEETRLVVDRFREFASSSHRITFLFVNDGSTDGTLGLLESLERSDPAKFSVLNLQRNCGKGEAVRQGLLSSLNSQPDYIGFWDADLATPLEAIAEFMDIAESLPQLEMVIGSRVKLLGRTIERRRSRHYLGRFFATAVSAVLKLDIYDTQCGAKLFRDSSFIQELFQKPFLSRWIFDVEIISRLVEARRGQPVPQPEQVIYELPLREWRDIPGSKVRCSDFVRAAWELLRIRNYYVRRRGL